MFKPKAVTHHHHTFLKQAYKHDELIELVSHERYLAHGDRYIKFDPVSGRFGVFIHTTDEPVRVRQFNDLLSAVNCARRNT